MPIQYYPAEDVKELVNEVVKKTPFSYIDTDRVFCYRSRGSRSKRCLARCYSFLKIWQKALKLPPFYIVEVLSERYDRLSQEEKTKVIIHELLHIPKSFGGGLRPHAGYVTRKAIDELYFRYMASKNGNPKRA